MRPLTPREKRTIRIGGIGLALYLLVFGGMNIVHSLEKRRADYQRLLTEAQNLKRETQLYEDKVLALKKLMEGFNLDPSRLFSTTVVAQASAAIQRAAASRGVMVGAVRETPARSSGKEMASIQLETIGPVPAITTFLNRLEAVGYPLIIENVQFTQEAARPGQLKLSLTLLILDFEQWKKTEVPSA
jgi:hypothetical protein